MRTRDTRESNRLYVEALIRIGSAYLKLMLREDAHLFRFRYKQDAALPTVYPRLSSDDVYSSNDTMDPTPSGFGKEAPERRKQKNGSHVMLFVFLQRASSID